MVKLFGFVEDDEQRNVNGIGLGLVISDSIVNKLGGKISFKSKINEGSTFEFTIKLNALQDNGS